MRRSVGIRVPMSRKWLATTLLAGLFPLASVAQSTPVLTLTERWSVMWRGPTRISRIVVHGEKGLAIQAGPSVYVLRDSLPPKPVGNFDLLDIAGMALTDEGLELLDRRTGRLIRTDLAGRVKSWAGISGVNRLDIASGVLTPCGWFMQ